MNRRILFSLYAPCSLLLAFSAQAQQQAKVPKIGWLGARPAASAGGHETIPRDAS